MALGDVVKIDGSGETQYDNLNDAVYSLPDTAVEDVTIEIRIDGATRDVGSLYYSYTSDEYTLTIKSGSGVTGKVVGDSYVMWLAGGNNVVIDGIEFESGKNDDDEYIALGAIRLGNNPISNITIQNCILTAQVGVYMYSANNIIVRDCEFFENDSQLVYVGTSNNVLIDSCTYSFADPSTMNLIAIPVNDSTEVTIRNILFNHNTFRRNALKFVDCGVVRIDRCWFGNSIEDQAYEGAINCDPSANKYSCDYFVMTNCIFDRHRTHMVPAAVKAVKIVNTTFKAQNWYQGDVVDHDNSQTGEYGLTFEMKNCAFQVLQGTGTATAVNYYTIRLDPTLSVKADYDLDYNTYYTDLANNYFNFKATSNSSNYFKNSLSGAKTSANTELNSLMATAPYIDSTYAVTDVARNGGDVTYQPYLDYVGKIRPTTTPDIGAVDSDSTTYYDAAINLSFFVYNITTGEFSTSSATSFALAQYDELIFYPSNTSSVVNNYAWTIYDASDSTNVYKGIGQYFYYQATQQEQLSVSVYGENDNYDDTITKADYLDIEQPRPIADFSVITSENILFPGVEFNLVDNSQYAETWSYAVETAPNSDTYTYYTSQNPTGLSLTDIGQYNVLQTVSNTGTNTGTRQDVKERIKVLNIVDPNQPPSFIIVSNEICREGDTVSFSIQKNFDFDIQSYEWRFDGGNIANSTSATPSVEFNTVGRYDVACKVTDTQGRSNWYYARRQITVSYSLTGRTTHTVDLSTLPADDADYSGGVLRNRWKMLDNDILGANPGDVIYLRGDLPLGYGLRLKHFHGTASDKFIIGNYPGEVATITYSATNSRYNIAFITWDNQHTIFDFKQGNLSNDFYGLEIDTASDTDTSTSTVVIDGGLKAEFFSDYVEFFGIHIKDSGFPAIQNKTEPSQDALNDPRWSTFVEHDTFIHHMKVSHCQGEGFYLGYNSIYNADKGGDQHKMENGLIYRNQILNAQKDGFQYGNGSGVWEIHDNYFYNNAYIDEGGQNSGMSVGTPRIGCETWIYNNVFDTFSGSVMQIWPAKYTYIFNNVASNQTAGGNYMIYSHNNLVEDVELLVIANNTFDGINDAFYFNMSKEPQGEGSTIRKFKEIIMVNNAHVVDDKFEISSYMDNLDDYTTYNNTNIYGYKGQDVVTNIDLATVGNNLLLGTTNSYRYYFNNKSVGDLKIWPGSDAQDQGSALARIPKETIGLLDSDSTGYLKPTDNEAYSMGAYEIVSTNGILNPNIGEAVDPGGEGPGGGEVIPPSEVIIGDPSNACDYVKGGLVSIGFLEFDASIVWVFDENGVIIGANNQQLEFSLIKTLAPLSGYTSEMTIGNAGIYYTQSITVGFNKMRQEVRNLISGSTNQRYYILGTDEYGAKWLFGQTHGIRVSDVKEQTNAETNGYSMTLTGINLFEVNRIVLSPEEDGCPGCNEPDEGELELN